MMVVPHARGVRASKQDRAPPAVWSFLLQTPWTLASHPG
jgi:hypothetical protein